MPFRSKILEKDSASLPKGVSRDTILTMKEAELELIEKLKAGEAEAFDAFLDVYGSRLYNFASKMCKSSEDARDVMQDTLISAFKALKNFRGESSFRTWLFKIAVNACRKMRRKGKFEPERELSLDDFMPAIRDRTQKLEIIDWSQNPEELFLRSELRSVVKNAIAELPTKYRVVLVLRDLEQLSTDEVSEILKLSPEAVKSRLHRARLYVREKLSQYLQPKP